MSVSLPALCVVGVKVAWGSTQGEVNITLKVSIIVVAVVEARQEVRSESYQEGLAERKGVFIKLSTLITSHTSNTDTHTYTVHS